MFSSLPDYRRFAEAALQRIRKDHKQKSSHRLSGMLFNILLLAGLWGLPLYARWVVVPDIHRSTSEPPSLIGKWQAMNGSHFSITFSADGQFVVSWKETVLETARYWFADRDQKDVLLFDFRKQPGNQPLAEEKRCWFSVSFAGKRLKTAISLFSVDEFDRDRIKPESLAHWEMEGEALRLYLADFERVE
jgi:hypothetical protein